MKKTKRKGKKKSEASAQKVRKVSPLEEQPAASDPLDAEALASVLEQAREDADAFLREEYRERLRFCLFAGTGLLFTSVFMGFFIIPVFDLEGNLAKGLVIGPIAGILALWFFRFRCTRCDRIPILPSTLFHFKTMDLPGCPHCGLKFHVEEPPDRDDSSPLAMEEE